MKQGFFAALACAVLLSACQSASNVDDQTFPNSVPANGSIELNYWISLNPDCTARGMASVSVVQQPQHGRISIRREGEFPSFSAGNPRSRCNNRRVPAIKAFYWPEPGYVGSDYVAVRVVMPSGRELYRRFPIQVR